MSETTVSRHFLRRRARQREAALQALAPAGSNDCYRVVRTQRGPYRWRVVRIHVSVERVSHHPV